MNTRYKILLCATKLFLEKGYKNTYVTMITNSLKISTGNLTFHFPTKEHILAELIRELNAFQHQKDADNKQSELSPVGAYLLELVMITSISEVNANIRDLIAAAYTHAMPLEIIRENDTYRAMRIFGEFCPNWAETDFIQAENVVSGIEYAMYRTENTSKLSFEQRMISGMDSIMKIYEVPADVRRSIIDSVMATDYRGRGSRVFEEFSNYIVNILFDNQEQ